MDATVNHPAEEVERLQRCMNDLLSVTALPALWSGGNPAQIARTLMDVLQRLLNLDLIYVQLRDPSGEILAELSREPQTRAPSMQPREISAELHRQLGDDSRKWTSQTH